MNWSSVKNFMIAILLAANIFLIYNIARQERMRNYVPDEDIASAIELLSERGLVVPKSAIPTKKFKADVYESNYNDRYYTNVAEMLTGSTRDVLLSTPDGGFSITAENGETVEFDTEFGFVYSKHDTLTDLAYTNVTADNFSDYLNAGEELSASKMKDLSEKSAKFLNFGMPEDHALSTEIAKGYYDPQNGYSYILAKQCVGGYEIYSHSAVCVFSDNELVHVKGRWYFASVESPYDTELLDQIDILFSDLTVLKSASASSYLGDDEDAVRGDDSDIGELLNIEIPAVKSVSPCYVMYWSSDKTSLYFTPAWQINHINGLEIVYNATNGTMYSQKD